MGAQVDGARHAGYELSYTNVDELMSVIDYLMTYAPPFSESSLVHCPLDAVLDWPMCMPSGYALFRNQAFNQQLKRVLNYWCGFLSGPYSRTHLNDAPDGWFSKEGIEKTRIEEFCATRASRIGAFRRGIASLPGSSSPGPGP